MRVLVVGVVGGAFVVAVGCGGKVVIDLPATGHGGAGGAPSVTTSTVGVTTSNGTTSSVTTSTVGVTTSISSTTVSTTNTASSTSGAPMDPCMQVCDDLAAKGCGGGQCVTTCQAALSGAGCAGEAAALLSCMEASLPMSTVCFNSACDPQREAHTACVTGQPCGLATDDGFFFDGSSSCLGKGGCAQLMGEPNMICDGSGTCVCSVGNTVIGKCQETGPFVCDINRGCCAALFAMQP